MLVRETDEDKVRGRFDIQEQTCRRSDDGSLSLKEGNETSGGWSTQVGHILNGQGQLRDFKVEQ